MPACSTLQQPADLARTGFLRFRCLVCWQLGLQLSHHLDLSCRSPAHVHSPAVCEEATLKQRRICWCSPVCHGATKPDLPEPNVCPAHRWAIAPQYIEHFRTVLSIFKVRTPTIQRDCPTSVRPEQKKPQLRGLVGSSVCCIQSHKCCIQSH